ncbi:NPCBM/NEW2 domain-containing protein [Tundrisphaera sp. TA3]|uniref:NPCBM/NEW2 domain-containing protein n=1 Tax=Tundrisphaera sp. TA3 TaxID=3435775 RepID=UPI003EB79C59
MMTPARRSRLPLLALAAIAIARPAPAQEPPSPGATIPSDPVFTAVLIDGTQATGRLRQLGTGPGAVLVEGPGQERAIPLDRLVKLARGGLGGPPQREGGLVLFPDGDRLTRCVIGGIGDKGLDVQSFALGALAIPEDGILGLILAIPTERDAAEALVAQVRADPRKSESLWMSNGDRISGGLLAFDEKAISFQAAAGKTELDRSSVTALGFDPGLVSYPRPEGIYLELTLVDGSRLGASGVRIERGQVVGQARFGSDLRLPLAELASVHVLGGPVTYLSDREATGVQYESYLGPTRPYRRDLNVDGHPIRLGGEVYDRGIGTQSRTLLAYRLEPGARRFQASVGVDDLAGPLGSVAFKVLLDGTDKVLFASPSMSAREAPKAIDVDITGGRLLILITEFGDRGDVQDHADWAEARIIR